MVGEEIFGATRVVGNAFRSLIATFAMTSAAIAGDYGQFGPFDYYDSKNTPIKAYALVESAHLGPKTELMLLQGDYCGYWGDLDYTLRAFPNHPKGLEKMARFLRTHAACNIGGPASTTGSATELADQIESGRWQGRTVEYYFETAIRYRPQYTEPRILYARALREAGKVDAALRVLDEAIRRDPKSAIAHYEAGSLLFKKGNRTSALDHAKMAYRLGSPPTDLREQLVSAGLWK